MFHRVRLQPADSPKELAALGLKLKRKRGQHYLLQPCPAFQGTHCSIYASRPERCRLFECRQLQRVNAGEITEAMALEKIREVKRRVGEVNDFLGQADETTDPKKPLMKRCEKVLAEPLDSGADDEARGVSEAAHAGHAGVGHDVGRRISDLTRFQTFPLLRENG